LIKTILELARVTIEGLASAVGGKYINLKTGKEVKPPKGAVAPLEGEVTQIKPKPAKPANPYYRLADPYYGYSDPYHGYLRLLCHAALQSGLHLRLRETGRLAINARKHALLPWRKCKLSCAASARQRAAFMKELLRVAIFLISTMPPFALAQARPDPAELKVDAHFLISSKMTLIFVV
jgi:hypothetical protein